MSRGETLDSLSSWRPKPFRQKAEAALNVKLYSYGDQRISFFRGCVFLARRAKEAWMSSKKEEALEYVLDLYRSAMRLEVSFWRRRGGCYAELVLIASDVADDVSARCVNGFAEMFNGRHWFLEAMGKEAALKELEWVQSIEATLASERKSILAIYSSSSEREITGVQVNSRPLALVSPEHGAGLGVLRDIQAAQMRWEAEGGKLPDLKIYTAAGYKRTVWQDLKAGKKIGTQTKMDFLEVLSFSRIKVLEKAKRPSLVAMRA